MDKTKTELKIKKKTFFMITALILVVAILSVSIIYFKPLKQEAQIIEVPPQEIQAYKKMLYEGTLCHYSCPLTEIKFEGNPLLFPDPACSQKCSENLKKVNPDRDRYTEQQLTDDNLLLDIERAIALCRNKNNIESDLNVENTKEFFNCASKDLDVIKENYPYII